MYATTVAGRPVGLPAGQGIRQSRTNNHGQKPQGQQNPPGIKDNNLEDLQVVEKEVVLHGIPTLINGAPAGKKSDEARVKKILRELHGKKWRCTGYK